MAMVQNQWDPILVGRCTTHVRTDFGGWIGMFTGGTIWVLTHSHIVRDRYMFASPLHVVCSFVSLPVAEALHVCGLHLPGPTGAEG